MFKKFRLYFFSIETDKFTSTQGTDTMNQIFCINRSMALYWGTLRHSFVCGSIHVKYIAIVLSKIIRIRSHVY